MHRDRRQSRIQGTRRPPDPGPRAALMFAVSLIAVALAASGCTGSDMGGGRADGGTDGSDACPTFSQVTIWPLCTPCHASTVTEPARMLATPGVDFDVYSSAANNAVNAQIYVEAMLMPPPPDPPASAAQVASLNRWVACGTPP
ncbi:MAG: hypothetical protein ABUS79_05500 [Pseudomonadota bacterium]